MRITISPFSPLGMLMALSMSVAPAAELPPVERLQEQMGRPAGTIEVHEPHLSVGDRRIAIEYVGYPAVDVLARVLGTDWQEQAGTARRSPSTTSGRTRPTYRSDPTISSGTTSPLRPCWAKGRATGRTRCTR